MNGNQIIKESFDKLDNWLIKNNWKGYDPFDGLNARISRILTLDNHYLRIALQQTVRRLPINLRPLLGIEMESSSKGMGFCAMAYAKMYRLTEEVEYLQKMKICLNWLIDNYNKNYHGYSWGNHFSYESRGGQIPKEVPTIVWTAWIGNAFMDAYEITNEEIYFEIAKGVAEFIVLDIGRYEDEDGSICFMYRPGNKNSGKAIACVHNANVLGAWILSRVYQYTKNEEYFELARRSINYTMKYQRPQGGWWYGEPKKFQWEDNFHTGYNLESIYGYIKSTGDISHETKLKKAFNYYINTFFGADGTPRYYNYKTFPIDIQCASQGIQTLVNLSEYNDRALELAQRVALWTINNMQDEKGYFYFRKYPYIINKTPMFHWGQSTMLSALASLREKTGKLMLSTLVQTNADID